MAWLLSATRLDRPRLPVLLTLHGKHPRSERELAGWPGYAGSAPVRSGNAAADQHQLDGYGWVLDAAWRLSEAGTPCTPRRGAPWPASPTEWRTVGASPMPASGKCAPTPCTTCTPS